jgi:hypothetical protein
VTESNSDSTKLRLIKDEKLSTQKCLQICDQLSEHINHIQLIRKRSADSPGPIDPDAMPERVISTGLQECKNSLTLTATRLEKRMRDIKDQLMMKSKTAMTSEDEGFTRLREEWETARQCLDICLKADESINHPDASQERRRPAQSFTTHAE